MGKPKRVIVWEGDTSNLPNRNEKKNIVYTTPVRCSISPLIEIHEDAINPTAPYKIKFNNAGYKIIQITRPSKIERIGSGGITEVIITRFNSNECVYPNFGVWYNPSGIIHPGLWMIYSSLVGTVFNVTPCITDADYKGMIMSSSLYVKKLDYELIFGQLTNTRMLFNSDNSGCISSFAGSIQIPLIVRKSKDVVFFYKFSIENIRKSLESGEEALVVFAHCSWYDGDIISNFSDNFKKKTYEQLGIQDLYEKYLEQSK